MTRLCYEYREDDYGAPPELVSITKELPGTPYFEMVEFTGPSEPQDGDAVYAVCVTYSTGNTFGRDDTIYLSLAGAYHCLDDAAEQMKKVDSGEVGGQWNGYFKEVVDLYIKKFSIGPAVRSVWRINDLG